MEALSSPTHTIFLPAYNLVPVAQQCFAYSLLLSENSQLGIHGNLIVLRVASNNAHSVVNMRSSNDRYVDLALHS